MSEMCREPSAVLLFLLVRPDRETRTPKAGMEPLSSTAMESVALVTKWEVHFGTRLKLQGSVLRNHPSNSDRFDG